MWDLLHNLEIKDSVAYVAPPGCEKSNKGTGASCPLALR